MSNYAGSYKFKRISIKKNNNFTDMSGILSEVNVFSYIDQPSTTVMITCKDSQNFLNDFPIKGGQEIEFEVEFDKEIRIWNLVIASIEDVSSTLNTTMYNLRCVSHILFKSHFNTISQSFNGKVSDIAKSIFNQYKNENEEIRIWEDSSNNSSYVIPGWSPVQTIMWLASKSRAKNTDTRFKFFQDSFLKFNFIPLEILNEKYLDEDIQSFHYHIFKSQDTSRKKKEMGEILSYSLNNTNDVLESLSNGYISGSLFDYNMTSKNSTNIVHNYLNDFKNFKNETSNKKPLWNKSDFSNSFVDETFDKGLEIEQISRFKDDDLSDVNAVIDKSNIIKSFFNTSNNLVTIDVRGNNVTDIGQIINIEFPRIKPLETGKLLDEMTSGRYLIVGKRQQFSVKDNVMHLDCIRDSNLITSSYSGNNTNEDLGGEDV